MSGEILPGIMRDQSFFIMLVNCEAVARENPSGSQGQLEAV